MKYKRYFSFISEADTFTRTDNVDVTFDVEHGFIEISDGITILIRHFNRLVVLNDIIIYQNNYFDDEWDCYATETIVLSPSKDDLLTRNFK